MGIDTAIFVVLPSPAECRFLPVTGVEVHSGNIEKVLSKEKVKFPQEFFPEVRLLAIISFLSAL